MILVVLFETMKNLSSCLTHFSWDLFWLYCLNRLKCYIPQHSHVRFQQETFSLTQSMKCLCYIWTFWIFLSDNKQHINLFRYLVCMCTRIFCVNIFTYPNIILYNVNRRLFICPLAVLGHLIICCNTYFLCSFGQDTHLCALTCYL